VLRLDLFAGAACSLAIVAICTFLAVASVDRRRIAWTLAAISAAAALAHTVMPIPLWPELANLGLPRAALASPLAVLVPATANALCAAVAFMLVADPGSIDDLGFQLSALATAGLVLWQASLAERLEFLPGVVGQGIATTLAATAPTLPLVAAAFGRLSLVSPLANLVCVPLFPLLMLAGAATSLAG